MEVAAAKVVQVRRELFGEPIKVASKAPGAIDHIRCMANTIATVVAQIGAARKGHAAGHRAWIRTLDHLDESQKLLAKLVRL